MLLSIAEAKPCSTFMLHNDSTLIYGQNLDMPYSIPGYITKNNRGVVKQSITWGQISQNGINNSPRKIWTSKYGSITFTPMCREFPEGGINEAGLYVREMSLPGTAFPVSDNKPNVFMMQWIQYQLDNYALVQDVIDHIDDLIIDGWAWHFFVADSSGNSASIDFIKGEAVIYSGEEMPYKIMTNSTYKSELENISEYEGFGGSLLVESANNRFVKAAAKLKNASAADLGSPVNFGFDVLNNSLGNSGTRWSVIVDVKNAMVYFKSSIGEEIKKFSYNDFNYDCASPVMICDINLNDSGDVSDSFVTYTREKSLEFIGNGIEKVFGKSKAPIILKNTHNYTTCCEIDYFGQTPPGDSAVVFAPGVISLDDRYEYGPFFAPDGKTFYFGVTNSTWRGCKLWGTKYIDGAWTTPSTVQIINTMDGWMPTITPDGNSFYFTSAHPSYPPTNIWKCDIVNDTLTNLRKLNSPLNSNKDEWRASESENNLVVFSSNRSGTLGPMDLYYCTVANDTYSTPINFGKPVNSNFGESGPYLSPDESYIIFESDRPGGFGQADLHISYKKTDGSWTNPKNMGRTINTSWGEDLPSITPDGKHLIFCRREAWVTSKPTHIYWISSSIIDSLKNTNFIPYVKNDIPNDTFNISPENNYTIPDTIFVDDDGNHTLTYSAQLYDGTDLPAWLNFDKETKTFSGTPAETGIYRITVTATDTANTSASDVFMLFIEDGTGINRNILNSNITLFPNPANGEIHIKNYIPAQIKGYTVMDISGKSIKQGKLHSNTIDVSEMNKGIYIIKLKTNSGLIIDKIIKQ